MLLYVIATIILLDQFTKAAVRASMYLGESIPVFPPFFHLTYIINPGAAFGLLADQTTLFVIVTAFLVTGVLLGYRRITLERKVLQLGLGLIVGGSLGNLVDRLRYGGVVDFLDFRVWPVFNLADMAIVVGAGLLLIELLRVRPGNPSGESGS